MRAGCCPYCGGTDICETMRNADDKDCECLDCGGRWKNGGRR